VKSQQAAAQQHQAISSLPSGGSDLSIAALGPGGAGGGANRLGAVGPTFLGAAGPGANPQTNAGKYPSPPKISACICLPASLHRPSLSGLSRDTCRGTGRPFCQERSGAGGGCGRRGGV